MKKKNPKPSKKQSSKVKETGSPAQSDKIPNLPNSTPTRRRNGKDPVDSEDSINEVDQIPTLSYSTVVKKDPPPQPSKLSILQKTSSVASGRLPDSLMGARQRQHDLGNPLLELPDNSRIQLHSAMETDLVSPDLEPLASFPPLE